MEVSVGGGGGLAANRVEQAVLLVVWDVCEGVGVVVVIGEYSGVAVAGEGGRVRVATGDDTGARRTERGEGRVEFER